MSAAAIGVRDALKNLTANFALVTEDGGVFVPQPLTAEGLTLSALGAWLRAKGTWDVRTIDRGRVQPLRGCQIGRAPAEIIVPAGDRLALNEYQHVTAMGRDQLVRSVAKGALYPFGHRASLIEVSERAIGPSRTGESVAYLTRRKYLDVHDDELEYTGAPYVNQGRQMPFSRVRVEPLSVTSSREGYCWFQVTAEDREDTPVSFAALLRFVPEGFGDVTPLAAEYTATAPRFDLRGQRVAFAAASSNTSEDTRFNVFSIAMSAYPVAATRPSPAPQASFLPVLVNAEVTIPAIEHLAAYSSGRPVCDCPPRSVPGRRVCASQRRSGVRAARSN